MFLAYKMALLSGKQIVLILVFTIVETVTLTAWLILLGIPINMTLGVAGVAATVLFVGLLIEHAIAIIAGDFPAKGAIKPQNGS
jgi:hypothetical protein